VIRASVSGVVAAIPIPTLLTIAATLASRLTSTW